jgi:hypothetical protein
MYLYFILLLIINYFATNYNNDDSFFSNIFKNEKNINTFLFLNKIYHLMNFTLILLLINIMRHK